MDSRPPGPSIHGISQARILEGVAISSSRESSGPRDRTLPSLGIFKLQIFANLKNIKLYPLVTAIALITSEIEHIFMNILTIFSSIMLSIHIVAHFIFLDLFFWS